MGNNTLNISSIMMILLIAAFCNCGLRYTTANILAAMGKVKYNMAVSAAGMVLQIAINIKMVPAYGTLAVVMTEVCGCMLMAFTLLFIFIQGHYRNRQMDSHKRLPEFFLRREINYAIPRSKKTV